jgi:ABC-type branched-subunit amino acid transport system ATPase component
VEQNLSFALELADHIYVMNQGKIVYEYSPKNSKRTKRLFIGTWDFD